MPVFPVRGLAERGLVLDTPPQTLGINAFSNGSNVSFSEGAVRRSSVLRTARSPNAAGLGRAAVGFPQSTGYDRIMVGCADGTIREVAEDSTTTDVSPTGLVPALSADPWTADLLGDVLYMNKPTHVPCYHPGGSATQFTVMPGWDPTHRARAIAASRDQLFAVNITKGTAVFPNTVRISDYALYGQPPATWDPTEAGVANEITLSGARNPLVGCLDLDGVMIVYAERQSWRFSFTGDTSNAAQNLWVNEPLSLDKGMIGPNAAAYFERRHYVFGADDLYVTDGVSTTSLATDLVRRWVFRRIDATRADRCFVAVDGNTETAIFAFPSIDADAAYSADVGCNRAAVFSLRSPRWALIDLPDCTSAGSSNFNPTLTWSGAAMSWGSLGGSWGDLSDGFSRNLMMLSPLFSPERILAFDEAFYGRVPFEAALDANPTAFVERVGLDLDEIGAGLKDYKIISTVFPELEVYSGEPLARFRVGSALYPQGPYTWSDWRSFDPATEYRVDFNRGGRYLGIRLEVPKPLDFAWSGMDVDLKPGGRR